MLEQLLVAVSLMLVVEGIMPFMAPSRWRLTLMRLLSLQDQHIRLMGLGSMLLGVVILLLVNG